jgi:hypothetical protein
LAIASSPVDNIVARAVGARKVTICVAEAWCSFFNNVTFHAVKCSTNDSEVSFGNTCASKCIGSDAYKLVEDVAADAKTNMSFDHVAAHVAIRNFAWVGLRTASGSTELIYQALFNLREAWYCAVFKAWGEEGNDLCICSFSGNNRINGCSNTCISAQSLV